MSAALETPQIIPYLYYPSADAALEFLQKAFGFELISAFRAPDGRVLTARLRHGSGMIMVGPGMDVFGTGPIQNPDLVPSRVYVYVEDVDAHHERAQAAGVQIRSKPAIAFGGEKQYSATDPGGHRWTFSQHARKS